MQYTSYINKKVFSALTFTEEHVLHCQKNVLTDVKKKKKNLIAVKASGCWMMTYLENSLLEGHLGIHCGTDTGHCGHY